MLKLLSNKNLLHYQKIHNSSSISLTSTIFSEFLIIFLVIPLTLKSVKSMQYFAGLVIFSGIGSFLISDTIYFGRELRKTNSSQRLYLDFLRLLVLGGMALIESTVAAKTFDQPNDWIVFLVIGVIGAFSTHTFGVRTADATQGGRRP